MRIQLSLLLGGLLAVPGILHGQFITHGNQPNVVVFGDFTSTYTETNGALWVKGSMTVTGYNVGVELGGVASDHPTLVVGKNLTYTNGEISYGSAYVGGTVNATGMTVKNGTLNNSVPIDFNNVYSSAKNKSQELAQMADAYNSLTVSAYGVMNLSLNSGVNVVNIAGSTLKNINTFNISGASDSVVIFNVPDTHYLHEAWTGMNENQLVGISSNQILFNFYNAEEVKLDRLGGILGSVLAPDAHVTSGWGSMKGQLIAGSYSGNTEFYNQFFNWPQPIPEPATVAMLGVLGMAGMVGARQWLRRKDKSAA